VISRMLDVEDVEDVACSVDDIECTDRLGSLVQRGWSWGTSVRGPRESAEGLFTDSRAVETGDPHDRQPLRHYLFQALPVKCLSRTSAGV
jgi:hypothetical protein